MGPRNNHAVKLGAGARRGMPRGVDRVEPPGGVFICKLCRPPGLRDKPLVEHWAVMASRRGAAGVLRLEV